MSQETNSVDGPGDSTVTTASSGIYPSSSSSSSSSDEDGDGGSLSDLMEEYMWEFIVGDPMEEEIEAQIEAQLLRAAGASRAVLRQHAAHREEARAQAEAFRRKVAAERKAMRKQRRALRREAAQGKELMDLLQTDISGYTYAQRAEYFRELDRRSNQVVGGGGKNKKGGGGG